MRIYISGPITGRDDFMEKFRAVEERLTKEGHQVYNPADAIFMLKGWENSRGANREYGYALGCDMEIFEEQKGGTA